MKTPLFSLLVLFCLTQACQPSAKKEAQQNEKSSTEAAASGYQLSDLVGTYSHVIALGENTGGTPIQYFHSIVLDGKGLSYAVDGYQMMRRLECSLKPLAGEEAWEVYFENYGEEDLFKSEALFKKGQKLFRINYKEEARGLQVLFAKGYPDEQLAGQNLLFDKEEGK